LEKSLRQKIILDRKERKKKPVYFVSYVIVVYMLHQLKKYIFHLFIHTLLLYRSLKRTLKNTFQPLSKEPKDNLLS